MIRSNPLNGFEPIWHVSHSQEINCAINKTRFADVVCVKHKYFIHRFIMHAFGLHLLPIKIKGVCSTSTSSVSHKVIDTKKNIWIKMKEVPCISSFLFSERKWSSDISLLFSPPKSIKQACRRAKNDKFTLSKYRRSAIYGSHLINITHHQRNVSKANAVASAPMHHERVPNEDQPLIEAELCERTHSSCMQNEEVILL